MPRPQARLAAKRVGSTPLDHARWMIALAYRFEAVEDLSTLPSEDVQVLLAELTAFCPDDPARPDTEASPDTREAYAIRWLRRIRNGIRQLNRGRAWGHRLVTHYSLWVPREGQKDGHYTPWSRYGQIERQPDRLYIRKTTKDTMAHKICGVFATVGDQLRRCQRLGCGRLFVRHKRQLYCTPSCASVVRTRRHRARQRQTAASQ
jgi:hypothetical protein